MIFSIVLFISCSDDDENCLDHEEVALVTAVDAPLTATLNDPVAVDISFQVRNSCGEFAGFREDISGTTRTIEVIASYEGCACAEGIVALPATYTFTPERTGQHLIRIGSGESFIERTIDVESSTSSEGE